MSFLPLNNGELFFVGEDAKTAIYELLKEKTRKLGHKMSFKEAISDPEMVHPNQYAYFFGSFDKAAEMAWREVQDAIEDDDDENNIVKIPAARLEEMRARRKEKGEPEEQKQEKPRQRPPHFLNWAQRSSPWEKKRRAPTKKEPPSNSDQSRVKYKREEVIVKLSEFYYVNDCHLPSVADCNMHSHGLPSDTKMLQLFGTRDHWLEIIKEYDNHASSEK